MILSGKIPSRWRIPGNPVDKKQEVKTDEKSKGLSRWLWRLSLLTTGLAGAALVLLRGCWHRRMSWPIRVEGYSYQVCLGCGVKRLFDESTFHGYGPYSYDLLKLIARERAARMKEYREEKERMSSAS